MPTELKSYTAVEVSALSKCKGDCRLVVHRPDFTESELRAWEKETQRKNLKSLVDIQLGETGLTLGDLLRALRDRELIVGDERAGDLLPGPHLLNATMGIAPRYVSELLDLLLELDIVYEDGDKLRWWVSLTGLSMY